jgi:hypothetical protein
LVAAISRMSAGKDKLEADPQRRQQALQYCGNANQHHQDFEKIGEPSVADEFVDDPEANRADDADDQDVNQD